MKIKLDNMPSQELSIPLIAATLKLNSTEAEELYNDYAILFKGHFDDKKELSLNAIKEVMMHIDSVHSRPIDTDLSSYEYMDSEELRRKKENKNVSNFEYLLYVLFKEYFNKANVPEVEELSNFLSCSISTAFMSSHQEGKPLFDNNVTGLRFYNLSYETKEQNLKSIRDNLGQLGIPIDIHQDLKGFTISWYLVPRLLEKLATIELKPKESTKVSTNSFSMFNPAETQKLENELFDLCWYGKDIFRIKQLLDHPFLNINQKFRLGETCLFRASMKGHIKVVQLLLEHGAEIHVNSLGSTPIQVAANKEIINLLSTWNNKSQNKI